MKSQIEERRTCRTCGRCRRRRNSAPRGTAPSRTQTLAQTLETLTLANAPVRYAAAANRIVRNWGRIGRGDRDGGDLGMGSDWRFFFSFAMSDWGFGDRGVAEKTTIEEGGDEEVVTRSDVDSGPGWQLDASCILVISDRDRPLLHPTAPTVW
jgi:hypothetical protein